MNYQYDDISKYSLTSDLCTEFLVRLSENYNIGFIGPSPHTLKDVVEATSKAVIVSNSYKKTLDYVLAEGKRERAIAAFNGINNCYAKDDILKLWSGLADKMTSFEKVMLGWDKV